MRRRIERLARVCVAVALGRESTIRRELRSALDDRLNVEDVREAILQTYLFAGFPRAINGLWILREEDATPPAKPPRRPTLAAGRRLCRRIYGRDYEPMLRNMRRMSPDIAAWILEEGYAKTLSRPRFTARERELLIVPTLIAMDAWRQLPSHVIGARNVGATASELARGVRAVSSLVGAARVRRAVALLGR